ncbi:glycoside hydrolase family 13 protein [Micromonospora sp. WMMD980]|uniref:glycoside hydrolase family 13 protein n=1 Tax=Micromonospora sp. WMMD980 TaxID=3016088 RepID=UPI00241802F9|nr:glycoside hydrolase family 13 protein [Micromonospora sp. WMMD980]MDG4803757.1 glycoside hydrolase family 13 protein [Micromonospora sp. WMMD980]
MPRTVTRSDQWWRSAVIYQVYVRSFADANGDGVGDLAGVRERLPYLAELGVDALWFSPWFASPQADAGYDVADYRDIDPLFGDLADAEAVITEAHALGLKVIIDIVPNHVSDQHAWFKAAVAAGPGSPERERFWFRPGRGDLPPNDWQSVFGGPAWTRVPDGEWYLHLFAPEQPDVNWNSPDTAAEHEDVLRFWFDRGADGIRIDSATMPAKDPDLADFDAANPPQPHPFIDRDAVHDIYRAWRTVADEYDPPRALIGEIWLDKPDRLAMYLRPDEMHTAFNFDYLNCAWDPKALRHVIDATIKAHVKVDAPPTWVLSNHDVTRHVTRYGRADSSFGHTTRQHTTPVDLAKGTRRARAALMLNLALPGSVYLYQGEELGLDEVDDLPAAARQDPIFFRTGGQDVGRDGCRVPLPWSGTAPPFGFSFSSAGVSPWLPQPTNWATRTAQIQSGDPESMLELYRTALRLRREHLNEAGADLDWLPGSAEVLNFTRPGGFTFLANLSDQAVPLPNASSAGSSAVEVLLASGPLTAGAVPPDTAVWLRTI